MSAVPDNTVAPVAETPANPTTTTVTSDPAAPAPKAAGGAVDDKDVEHWKTKINAVLAKPSEHINSKSPEGSQAWHSGFFDCFNPIDLCLLTYCLPCVTFGKTHHRMHKNGTLEGYEPINTSCMLFCASGCFGLFWIPMAIQRADIREKYHLQGDCVTDIAASCCCGLCSLVQSEKETTYQEPLLAQSAAGDKAGYQADAGMSYAQPQ